MRSYQTLRGLGRHILVCAAFAPLLSGCASDDAGRFQKHINYLASDKLEGRGVGSPGIQLAADYTAKEFARAGLKPAGDNGTYFQTFSMTLNRQLTSAGRLDFEGQVKHIVQARDYIPLSVSSDEAFSGKVTFCGYGIVAPEHQYDDFAGLDLKGRVAMMFFGEPPSWADAEGFASRRALLQEKIYNAKDRGAVAVLLVNPKLADGDEDRLTELDTENADEYGIPTFHLTRATVEGQLARVKAPDLSTLQAKLDAGTLASTAIDGLTVSGQAGFEKRKANTHNVVGMIPGTDPAGEAIVIGAHYDHLGKRKPMSRTFKAGKLVREQAEPQIHNGADDNASGTSGLFEIARRFRKDAPPKRNVIFIAFTGEEAGLHGSKYYVDHPVVPIEKTVAMLNMDMIGRLPSDAPRLQVFGVDTAAEFKALVESAGSAVELEIVSSRDEGGRSDHAPFTRKNVPAMHFFTGHHPDYHKPSDDSEKINALGGVQVAELVYRVASDLANRDQRVVYQAPAHSGAAPKGTSTYRVVMGLAPGYVDDGKPGMLVEGVNAQGPADMAGMKSGDRIIRIGGKKVANIYDYMAATRNNKAGETVEVVVLRGDRELTLQVVLAGSN